MTAVRVGSQVRAEDRDNVYVTTVTRIDRHEVWGAWSVNGKLPGTTQGWMHIDKCVVTDYQNWGPNPHDLEAIS